MSSGVKRRHHTIPQMLQKHFVDEEGFLYFFSKNHPEKGICRVTPKNLFIAKNIYSEIGEDGRRDTWLEDYFAEIEGKADKVIRKVVLSVRANIVPTLLPAEKDVLNEFQYLTFKRVPEVNEEVVSDFKELVEKYIAEFENKFRPLTSDERARFNDVSFMERYRQNTRVKSLGRPSSPVLRILGKMGLCFARISQKNKSFILGSHPTVRFNSIHTSELGKPGVELWLPLSRDVAIAPHWQPGFTQIVNLYDSDIRKFNEVIVGQSKITASHSDLLLKSLHGLK